MVSITLNVWLHSIPSIASITRQLRNLIEHVKCQQENTNKLRKMQHSLDYLSSEKFLSSAEIMYTSADYKVSTAPYALF